MYKKNAIVVAVIMALLALFIVVVVTSVLNHDGEARYGEVTAPAVEEETMTEQAPAITKEEAADTVTETVVEETPVMPAVEAEPIAEAETTTETEEAPAPVSGGEVHVVTAQGLKYEPLVVMIQPGDMVAWENMPSHDTQSLEGLIPEGAEAWHSPLGENYQRTFTVEGIYVYKCTPHIGAGMGGAIIVGKPVNLAAIMASDVKGAEGRLVKKAIAAAQAM